MALIECPECGKEISSFASMCPKCGCPADKFETAREEHKEEEKLKQVIIEDIERMAEGMKPKQRKALESCSLNKLREFHQRVQPLYEMHTSPAYVEGAASELVRSFIRDFCD